MRVIGFSGKAGCGKSTASIYARAHLLKRGHDVPVFSFSSAIKETASAAYGWPLALIYEDKGFFDSRYGITIREALQRIGAEYFRNSDPDHWIKRVGWHRNMIIDDVRFWNEANTIKSHGGIVIRIESDRRIEGVDYRHSSETAMDNYDRFDSIIINNGTLNELEQNVIRVVDQYFFGS